MLGLLLAALPALPLGPHIPFVAGLTITGTVHEPYGDVDAVQALRSVAPTELQYTLFNQRAGQRTNSTIVARTSDRQDAQIVVYRFRTGVTHLFSAAMDPSLRLFRQLKSGTAGVWKFRNAAVGVDTDYIVTRLGTQDVPFAIIVNDVPVQEPAIHASMRPLNAALGAGGEGYILDDADVPLMLRTTGKTGDTTHLTKISFPGHGNNSIEQRLTSTKRASVYGIYFDFDRETVREESAPALEQIAQALNAHPAWNLTVEGHTDNVGSAPYNLDLSRRRAEAVKAALVAQYRIGAGRLATSGYGSTRPKGPNDTIQGRALNRRVELVLR